MTLTDPCRVGNSVASARRATRFCKEKNVQRLLKTLHVRVGNAAFGPSAHRFNFWIALEVATACGSADVWRIGCGEY